MTSPAWLFHRVLGARLFDDPTKVDAEWRDTPAGYLNPAADCCAIASETRGYQHTADCVFCAFEFGAPSAPDAQISAPIDVSEAPKPATATPKRKR